MGNNNSYQTLWSKGVQASKAVEDFTVGNDNILDLKIAKHDVLGSKAHIKMLSTIGSTSSRVLTSTVSVGFFFFSLVVSDSSSSSSSASTHPSSAQATKEKTITRASKRASSFFIRCLLFKGFLFIFMVREKGALVKRKKAGDPAFFYVLFYFSQ